MSVYIVSFDKDDRNESNSAFRFQTDKSIELGITNQIAVQSITGIPLGVSRIYVCCGLCRNTLPDGGLHAVICDVYPGGRIDILYAPEYFLYYPINDGRFCGSVNRFDVQVYNEDYTNITPQIGGIVLRIEINLNVSTMRNGAVVHKMNAKGGASL